MFVTVILTQMFFNILCLYKYHWTHKVRSRWHLNKKKWKGTWILTNYTQNHIIFPHGHNWLPRIFVLLHQLFLTCLKNLLPVILPSLIYLSSVNQQFPSSEIAATAVCEGTGGSHLALDWDCGMDGQKLSIQISW